MVRTRDTNAVPFAACDNAVGDVTNLTQALETQQDLTSGKVRKGALELT